MLFRYQRLVAIVAIALTSGAAWGQIDCNAEPKHFCCENPQACMPVPGPWDLSGDSQSPGNKLTQIDERNYKGLELAWAISGVPKAQWAKGAETFGAIEPMFANGRLYLSGFTGVYAVDAEDHTFLWKYEPKRTSPRPSVPRIVIAAMDRNNLYVAEEGELVALSSATGKIVWSGASLPFSTSALVVDRDIVRAFTGNKWTYSIDARTGRPIDDVYSGPPPQSSMTPLVSRDRKILLAPIASGFLVALDARTKRELWRHKLSFSPTSIMAYNFSAKDYIVVGSDGGDAWAFALPGSY